MARPFYFELADRWFRSRAVDADDSLQQTAELLYACTGVEACGERAAWDALVAPRSAQEHEELLRLPAAGNANAAVAGLNFMLSQHATPDDIVKTH